MTDNDPTDPSGTAVTDIISDPGADALEPTLEAAQPAEEHGPEPTPANPELGDVARVAGNYARAKGAGAGAWLRAHRALAALIAFAAVAAALALVLLGVEAADLPSVSLVEQTGRERVEAPDSSGGFFGFDDPLPLTNANVDARRRLAQAPEDAGAAASAAGAWASADVTLTYRNDHVSAVKTATLSFAKVDGTWTYAGAPTDETVAYTALAGVDEGKALANVGALLDEADDAHDGGLALSELYADGEFAVEEHEFDEDGQVDTLVISCSKSEGIASYACELTVRFRFLAATGTWEVASASVSEEARTRSLAALEGAWTGTFSSQESGDARCLAANETPLSFEVTFAGADDDAARLRLSVTSALAHFHAYPDADAARTDGDVVLADLTLECELTEQGDDGSLTFEGRLPQQAGGLCTLTLTFTGVGEGEATLTTQHSYTEDFLYLFPYEATATYADAYTLRKAG